MVAEKVVVQLVLDTSKYTANAKGAAASTAKIQGAADKTAGSMGKLSQTAGKLGVALGAAFAAKAVFDFAKSSINAFSNLDESINAVEVSFGDASEGVLALGENSAEQFGLSTRAVNEAAVAMSAFASKIDEADPADAFGNVLQRATDFASVMNIEVEESLLLFRSGLAGESEPLRKFGIDVSAATVSLVGLEAGLGGANGKLDEGEKVQARYLAIMEQTEKTAGDFANTSDGLANSQRILSAKWEEAQVLLGAKLAPAMTTLLKAGTDLLPVFILVVDVIGDIVTEAQPLIEAVGALAGFLGEAADASDGAAFSGGLLSDAWDQLNRAVSVLIDPVGTVNQLFGEGTESARGLGTEYVNLKAAHEIVDSAAGRLAGTLGNSVSATEEAETAAGRYIRVLSIQTEHAEAGAKAERERAAGIRAGLAAQAEAASPALRLIRSQQNLLATQQELAELRAATGEEKASVEELTSAELDLVAAQIEVDSSAANIAGRVNESAEAFIETGIQAGLLEIDLLRLIEIFNLFPNTVGINLILDTSSIGVRGGVDDPGGHNRRHGGPVSADEPFIVGEAGPELFIPDRAGRIIPNGAGVGGQSIIVNVNDSITTDLAADLSAGLIAAQITQQVEMLRV